MWSFIVIWQHPKMATAYLGLDQTTVLEPATGKGGLIIGQCVVQLPQASYGTHCLLVQSCNKSWMFGPPGVSDVSSLNLLEPCPFWRVLLGADVYNRKSWKLRIFTPGEDIFPLPVCWIAIQLPIQSTFVHGIGRGDVLLFTTDRDRLWASSGYGGDCFEITKT